MAVTTPHSATPLMVIMAVLPQVFTSQSEKYIENASVGNIIADICNPLQFYRRA